MQRREARRIVARAAANQIFEALWFAHQGSGETGQRHAGGQGAGVRPLRLVSAIHEYQQMRVGQGEQLALHPTAAVRLSSGCSGATAKRLLSGAATLVYFQSS